MSRGAHTGPDAEPNAPRHGPTAWARHTAPAPIGRARASSAAQTRHPPGTPPRRPTSVGTHRDAQLPALPAADHHRRPAGHPGSRPGRHARRPRRHPDAEAPAASALDQQQVDELVTRTHGEGIRDLAVAALIELHYADTAG
ncbi:MAG TPA: hypothetical protein VFF37_03830 [Streptomyces sp.]|nr:hypothetical protein [Streptomyces sp.]